ncbi:MAG: hypothetical protein ACI9OJ_004715 [Myxococcota bacterium]|jgi:hypothetical protein
MILNEALSGGERKWLAGLLATDVSEGALATATEGVYGASQVGKLPARLRQGYFERPDDGRYRVIDAIRRDVTFRRFNLMSPRPAVATTSNPGTDCSAADIRRRTAAESSTIKRRVFSIRLLRVLPPDLSSRQCTFTAVCEAD